MMVLCISGKAQHGKDTSANMLREMLEEDGFRVLVVHYADLLKYVCRSFFGWNGQKDEEGRSLLQYVGTDVIRKQDESFWVRFVGQILSFFPDRWDFVLIPDCRFPNEIRLLEQFGFDVLHIRVVRQNFESPLTEEQQRHPSETALDHIEPDILVENKGTLNDLRRFLSDLVVDLTGHNQMSVEEFEF